MKKRITHSLVPYGHKAAMNNKNSPVRYRHANAWRIGVADVSEAGFIPAQRGVWGEAPISTLIVVLRTLKQQLRYGAVRPLFGRTDTRFLTRVIWACPWVVGVARVRF